MQVGDYCYDRAKEFFLQEYPWNAKLGRRTRSAEGSEHED